MSYKYNFKDADYVLIDSEKLKKTMVKKKENQTSLGKKANVSHSTISHNLKEKRMNYRILKALCNELNVKPATYITSAKPANTENCHVRKHVSEKKEKKPTSGRYPWGVDKEANEKEVNEKTKHEQHCVAAALKPLPRPIEPDKPLIVELKASKSEIQELIDVQKEIRDALKALVEELR